MSFYCHATSYECQLATIYTTDGRKSEGSSSSGAMKMPMRLLQTYVYTTFRWNFIGKTFVTGSSCDINRWKFWDSLWNFSYKCGLHSDVRHLILINITFKKWWLYKSYVYLAVLFVERLFNIVLGLEMYWDSALSLKENYTSILGIINICPVQSIKYYKLNS